MIMEIQTYDSFPKFIVLITTLFSLAVYALGIFILARFGLWLVVLYILYCMWLEFRILQKSCVNCYYYGKRCGLGKGILCSWFFKQGKNENFNIRNFSWLNILPDFLVTLVPLILGIIALMQDFSWLLLLSLLVLLILATQGNAIIRSNFLCHYCKQRELGCAAERLFSSSK
jgi:hypothetical protein